MKAYIIAVVFGLLFIGCKQETQITILRDSVQTVNPSGQPASVQLSSQSVPVAVPAASTAPAPASVPTPAQPATPTAATPATATGHSNATAPTASAKLGKTAAHGKKGATTPSSTTSSTSATPVATTPAATSQPASAQSASSQAAYKIAGKTLTLKGTSTLHDWTMTASAFSGSATLEIAGNQLTSVSALTLSLPVHNLKSESSAMDNNAYSSLKADQYGTIVFTLTSATVSGGAVNANGNLTIAGATHAIACKVTTKINSDGSVSCTGSVPIKLSEFKIDRPSFMLGAMKVGDAMTLNFALVLSK